MQPWGFDHIERSCNDPAIIHCHNNVFMPIPFQHSRNLFSIYSTHSPRWCQVASCPSDMQGACLDIVLAYHNSPLLHTHKAYVASMWHGNIYIDHCTMEGLSSAGNIQGAPTDVLITLFKTKSIPNVLKWVDDFNFFRIPETHPLPTHTPTKPGYNYNIASILSIMDPLGIPWHPIEAKGQDSSSSVTYVGFVWSLDTHSISLSCKKCTKYLAKVQTFIAKSSDKASPKECLSIHGMLQQITFVY